VTVATFRRIILIKVHLEKETHLQNAACVTCKRFP